MSRYLLVFLLLVFLIKFSQAQWDWVNPSPQGNDLNCIVYAGNQTLLAAGNFGTILRSTNNGQDWSHVESGSELDIRDIEFYDANNGIAVGDSGLVIITTNGGMDWETIDLQVHERLWAVAYSDSLNITITGYEGVIFHSADGGNTWNSIPPPVFGDFMDVAFITPAKGFIAGMNENYHALILKTEDSGQNWSVALNGTFGSLYSISFHDELIGYAAGGDDDVIRTSDGGNTWSLCPELNYDIAKILAVDGDWVFAVSIYKDWMRSAENNKQWVFLNQADDKFAISVCKAGENEFWVAGLAGRLQYTPDLGGTIIDLSSGVFDHFIDISFPDPEHGFIMGHVNLLISSDGGMEWNTVPITGLGQYDGYPLAVSWVSTTTAYLLTEFGSVFRTTDGGLSWQSILKAGKAQWYSDIYMTDASHGFLVGGGASPGGSLWSVCMRTTTGVNWTSVNLPVGLPLNKVYFIN